MRSCLRITLLIVAATALLLLWRHRDFYFGPPYNETGDFAANAIQIANAKHGREIYGNYSRWRFHHPGPAFFYVYALGELVLRDAIRVFRSPHQAHAFAGMVLQSSFMAAGWALLARKWRSPLFLALAIPPAVLGFLCARSVLVSIWAPYVLAAPFFCFLTSCAVLAGGDLRVLPLCILAGGFLVHGHVAQPLFVPPLFLLAAVLCYRACPAGSRRKLFGQHLWFEVSALALLAVFLVPILVDLTRGSNSNMMVILAHVKAHAGETKSWSQSIAYLLSFPLGIDDPEKILETGGFALGAFLLDHWLGIGVCLVLLALPLFALRAGWIAPELRPLFRCAYGFFAVAIALSLVWGKIQDGGMFAFNGHFFYGEFFLLLLLNVAWISGRLAGSPRRPLLVYLAAISVGLLFAFPVRPVFFLEQNVPGIKSRVREALSMQPSDRGVFLSFEQKDWPAAAGVALSLTRLGRRFYVPPDWGFMFGREHVMALDYVALARAKIPLWGLGARGSAAQFVPIEGEFGAFLPYYTALSPHGGSIVFSESGNIGTYFHCGFTDVTAAPFVWTLSTGNELFFAPLPSDGDVEITLGAFPCLGGGQRLSVFLDERLLVSRHLVTETDIAATIPKSIWNMRPEGRLRIVVPDVCPIEGKDGPQLGVGVRYIATRAAPAP